MYLSLGNFYKEYYNLVFSMKKISILKRNPDLPELKEGPGLQALLHTASPSSVLYLSRWPNWGREKDLSRLRRNDISFLAGSLNGINIGQDMPRIARYIEAANETLPGEYIVAARGSAVPPVIEYFQQHGLKVPVLAVEPRSLIMSPAALQSSLENYGAEIQTTLDISSYRRLGGKLY